ncbi:helix-turn-helix domain-containing protein [Bdellovibrio svalbardensis]|uniref:Helix-turn-helix transcriptional regulator n=1 Tax=Bdellovibrio svalbardensis TaxID=2972972 RepID=A0ABT6DLY6_9BACT|nr:helix-turn-helix transcriptional regulator [Bdellovibrio svalbardensis]MDG0817813.1 helix-turn-helix transcriptional regulator [Bdellovibrio svalbardensis]
MTTELIEIDSYVLGQMLDKKNLSRQDFADKLGISTKTIQRWINGTVRRVRPDTLGRIAHTLEITPDQLCKSSVPIEMRPINRALEEICKDSFLCRIRVTDEYSSYLKLLKSFSPNELCSAQRMTLYTHIGFTSFYLGKNRASRMYLDEALKIAYSLNMPTKIISILSWSALREDFCGNRHEALSLVERCEDYLKYTNDCSKSRAEYLFRKGHVLYHGEQFAEAIPLIRDSILIEYKQPQQNLFALGMKYFHLSECYLRTRDFAKAKAALSKTARIAEKAGWVRGHAYSYFGLGIIGIFEKSDCQSVRASFAKARMLRSYTTSEKINTKAEQREFIYFAIKGQTNEARNLILNNIRFNRRFIHFFASSILDGLFFAKLFPESFSMRPSLIERATDYFEKNNLQRSLNALKLLNSKERISMAEFLELYVF